ncbi:hypothetical protein GCM10011608_12480 [Micromonospora sonchi]|uniref:Uncharacterized protein n=1 Tax=Micromonospora sonchi TaxID=1763543 RepID=A0A917TMR0_9ACTN|nr:hypothetical protein [Micromonospora sonchi]GGM29337.1 hypothetical protein GCM10011608_12480 [Micromonospora sonchi]
MDPTGVQARRFPLVARPRPACTPLPERVAGLTRRAAAANRDHDPAAGTAVINLAALLASDCGRSDLAHQWSTRLARSALADPASDFRTASHSLEPIINLARLRTRVGDGSGAWKLLEALYYAVASRTDITIDGILIPAARLTPGPTAHRELRQWLWTVLLSSGAHALATAGRWDDAYHRLHQHNGIGRRMLDGRQIAVIAHATAGRRTRALELLRGTAPGEPWEHAVTASLTLLCQPAPTMGTTQRHAVAAYQTLDTTAPGLVVFHTRLGMCLVDALGGVEQPAAQPIAADLIERALTDGYAARDVLAHPGCRAILTQRQAEQLTDQVTACGLGTGGIPEPLLAELAVALDATEAVIRETPAETRRLPNAADTKSHPANHSLQRDQP